MTTPNSKPTKSPWHVSILTLFPEMFPGPLGYSLAGQALASGLWSLKTHQIRDFGIGKHRQVDDTPAGGGAGMILRADVLGAAIDQVRSEQPEGPLLYLSPRGEKFTQSLAKNLSKEKGILLLAGRFEGIDERVIEGRQITEISIGDYILSGGEVAALAIIDACVRLLPGVLGAPDSLNTESFENNLLEYPQYTRPRDWEGHLIPEVLLSGNHKSIEEWRRNEAQKLTHTRRPDLLK